MTYFGEFSYLNKTNSVTYVSVRHVGAHPGGNKHGVSIQISIYLGKTFLRISRIRKILRFWLESSRGSLYIYLLSIPKFWTLSINPRAYTQIYTPTMVQERGEDGTPPQSFWYVAVFWNDFTFSGKLLIFLTRWGIF